MKAEIRSCVVLMVLAGGAAMSVPASAKSGEYLFDTLKKPAYRASWNALMRGKHAPAWLASYAKTKDGPATPSKTVTVHHVAYQANFVCKAHDCGANHFTVLFAPRGRKAWGLLVTQDTKRRFFGNPNSELQTALVDATRNE